MKPILFGWLTVSPNDLLERSQQAPPFAIGFINTIDEPLVAKRGMNVGIPRDEPIAFVLVKRPIALQLKKHC